MRNLNNLLLGFAGLALVTSVSAQDDGQTGFDRYFGLHKVSSDDDWTRHFRIGATVGLNVRANFKESGLFTISGNNPAAGTYDDGYVHPHGDTYTTDWGYNNASQYDAAAGTMTFQSSSSFTTSGSSSDDAGAFVGFSLAYGDNLWYWHHVRIGWEFGFDLLPISATDNETLSASVNKFTYVYNTGSIVVPTAPYQGSDSAGNSLFPSSPASVTTQTNLTGTITGTRSLDAMLYAVRLGPSFYCDLTDRIGLQVGAAPIVGIVTAEYKYNEIITPLGSPGAHNSGSFDDTDVIFGGDVNATLLFHFQDQDRNVDLFIGADYAPMEDASFSSGGRSAQLNFGGQIYLNAGVSWPF